MLYQERLKPAHYAIGDLWEQGQISVATEHLASAISDGLLNLVYPRLFKQVRNGKSVVVACAVADEIEGAVAAVDDLLGWMVDTARFPAVRLAAVHATVAQTRVQAERTEKMFRPN